MNCSWLVSTSKPLLYIIPPYLLITPSIKTIETIIQKDFFNYHTLFLSLPWYLCFWTSETLEFSRPKIFLVFNWTLKRATSQDTQVKRRELIEIQKNGSSYIYIFQTTFRTMWPSCQCENDRKPRCISDYLNNIEEYAWLLNNKLYPSIAFAVHTMFHNYARYYVSATQLQKHKSPWDFLSSSLWSGHTAQILVRNRQVQ